MKVIAVKSIIYYQVASRVMIFRELLMNCLLIHIGLRFAFVILEEICLGVKESSG